MKKRLTIAAGLLLLVLLVCIAAGIALPLFYPRPHRETVEASGLEPSLVYAVIKAESNFREEAVSRAGAVGLMQLMPSTAEFVCRMEEISFAADRLKEGEYNVRLGCAYLSYLLRRFSATDTALCAYNAGEGTVRSWLDDPTLSADGRTLSRVPYPETAAYLEKIKKFQKIYRFLYDKT